MRSYLWFTAIAIWAVIILLKWKFAFIKGKIGEWFVSKKLHELDPRFYTIIDNITIPSLGGRLEITQIDHVVVSNYGVFCIETKNYDGWIFGKASEKYWTQVIYRYKERFYNPLYQNFAHTKALEALIAPICPNMTVLSLIAFPSASRLKITGTDMVGSSRGIVSKIEQFTRQIISDEEKERICAILLAANIKDKKMLKEHLRGVRSLKNK